MESYKDLYQKILMLETEKYENGVFLTLNTFTNDVIKFEEQIKLVMHWLNCYCYGRAFRKMKKRLRIFGVIEKGEINKKLHIHLIVMFNKDLRRSFYDINYFIRQRWYKLLKAKGSVFGSLVDLQPINTIGTRVSYAIKTLTNKDNLSNLQFF